ncbi:MAG TPA: AI-2E family transporter [Actinomycetota bacterium]|nr:AI-2E family transporter [Actinomycetota bacterium]
MTANRATERQWPPVTYWMKVTVGVLLVIALASLTLAVGDILVLVFVSFILAMGFQPAVGWMVRRGLSRGWAVAAGLVSAIVVVGAFLALVLPDIVRQIGELVDAAPEYLREAQQGSGFLADLNERFDLAGRLQDLSATLPATALGLVGSFTAFVFDAVTVLVLTIYFTVNLPKLRNGVARLLGREHRAEFEEILDESVQRVGGYVLGNLAVSAVAGVTSFIALAIIGVPFAAALAFFVALTDLIPTVGALIAAAVASTVAAFVGVPQLIATILFFLIYQQVENYVIQPRVMQRTIEMSAPLVILAVLIGGSLLGVVGALLAIPTAAIIKVAVRELYVEDRIEELRAEERRRRARRRTSRSTRPRAGGRRPRAPRARAR